MTRLNIKETTLKALWGTSGNQCAFPGCTQQMVENSKIIGTACHIEAAEEGGQRYNPSQTDEERRSLENLILLCPTCHVRTNDVDLYTVTILKSMKYEHEAKFSGRIFSIPNDALKYQLRIDELIALRTESRARCIERWQAVGLSRKESASLADNPSVGKVLPDFFPTPENPLVILVAELGSGKSLIAERMFQTAIDEACEEDESPIPVYIEARIAVGKLREKLIESTQSLGDIRKQGACIFIDGADEVEIGIADELLREARRIVNTWPSTSIVITSRPLYIYGKAEEVIEVPKLSQEDAGFLISHVAGEERSWFYDKSNSLLDALERPLFAILYGLYLRNRHTHPAQSKGELLAGLVESSLGKIKADQLSTNQILQRLAVLSIDHGGEFVPGCDVASRDQLQYLFDSRLVIERDGYIGFPLPILAEWFAAHSLATGSPTASKLILDKQQINRWRYPITVFIALFNHDEVSRLLIPLVEEYPGFVSEIITDGLHSSFSGNSTAFDIDNTGLNIRKVMQAWINGIGSLAQLIAPVYRDNSLRPLGIIQDRDYITLSWYYGNEQNLEVVDIDTDSRMENLTDWPTIYSFSRHRQSAWIWHWSKEFLSKSLTNVLNRRSLPIESGPMFDENIWKLVRMLVNHRSYRLKPIMLEEIETSLAKIPLDVDIRYVNFTIHASTIQALRQKVYYLRSLGETEFKPPWPGPDEMNNSPWVWGIYSDKQILARARFVFTAAIQEYQHIIDTWFIKLAPRMETAVLLPAIFVGRIVPTSKRPEGSGPSMLWYWDPLPKHEQSFIDIELNDTAFDEDAVERDKYFDEATKKLQALRRTDSQWLSASLHGSGLTDLFQERPVTDLVYKWLSSDLKKINWLDGPLADSLHTDL